jgi:hypothetical protein
MPQYNDQQSRLAKAFSSGMSTSCSFQCACGRTHFVSAHGHGDYAPGELEQLQKSAKDNPAKFIEEWEFDTIDVAIIDGMHIVPDCPCGRYKSYCAFLEKYALEIRSYLVLYFADKRRQAESDLKEASQAADELAALPDE